MSKEAEARVRDELLQTLYASVLHAELAAAQRPARRQVLVTPAVVAGICAVLRRGDLLLLPSSRSGFEAFGALCIPASRTARRSGHDPGVGFLTLPREGRAAAALTLDTTSALARSGGGAVACVLLPPRSPLAGVSVGRGTGTWGKLAVTAARLRLPLLLVADYPATPRAVPSAKPPHRLPAPPYPSIPVDREDALATYRVAYECIARAREGGGPSRMDAVPFRLRGRPAPPDALLRLETMLRKRGAFSKSRRRRLERDILAELGGETSAAGT